MQSTLDLLKSSDPDVYAAMIGEEQRQREGLELIPSENYAFPEIYATNGSVFTNKYAEGYPGRRYYGGQPSPIASSSLAIERAKQLFRAEHANVQALSGSPMNQAVYMACLHAWRHGAGHGSVPWRPSDARCAGLSDGEDLQLRALQDFAARRAHRLRRRACDSRCESRPKIVLCGHSSYPRELDYARFRAIADDVGALTMADVSHMGGLIAGGALANPLDAGFDIVTTTTHKSLRGPRGGLILCKASLGAEDRPGGVSWNAGRTAHECGCRHRRHAEARRRACVQEIRASSTSQRAPAR